MSPAELAFTPGRAHSPVRWLGRSLVAVACVPHSLAAFTLIKEAVMAVRTAKSQWDGSLREGKGHMRLGGGAYEGAYSFQSRFEEGEGTNPEELIAAAHSGCFSMALSGELGRAGHEPKRISTTAKVHLLKGDGGFTIARIELETEGEVPGIDQAKFEELAEAAKSGCPVSRALQGGPEITVTARLA